GSRDVTARYAARTPVPGGTEAAGLPQGPPGATHTGVAGPGAAVAPMGGAGAVGAHAIGKSVAGGPHLAMRSDDAVADCRQTCAPPVFGDEGSGPDSGGGEPSGGHATVGAELAALKEELLS
ncbi:MAG: hypothetical protein QM634_16170, partial [Gordonia sp. (in: high G+C Gram-positive bacteria)]